MKDQTEIGIAGLPIPKRKLSPKNRYKFEKKRRENLGPNVGGTVIKKDTNPYFNPRSIRESRAEHIKKVITSAAKKAGDKNLDLTRKEVEQLHKKTYKQFTEEAIKLLPGETYGSKRVQDEIAKQKAARQKQKEQEQEERSRFLYNQRKERGIPFSDIHGKGFIKNGVKVYDT